MRIEHEQIIVQVLRKHVVACEIAVAICLVLWACTFSARSDEWWDNGWRMRAEVSIEDSLFSNDLSNALVNFFLPYRLERAPLDIRVLTGEHQKLPSTVLQWNPSGEVAVLFKTSQPSIERYDVYFNNPDAGYEFYPVRWTIGKPIIEGALPSGLYRHQKWVWDKHTFPLPVHVSVVEQGTSETAGHSVTGFKDFPLFPHTSFITQYVYLSPQNPPARITMLFKMGNESRQVYWAETNDPPYDEDEKIVYAGTLGTPGTWLSIQVNAEQLGIEKVTLLTGLGFYNDRGTVKWGPTYFGTPPRPGNVISMIAQSGKLLPVPIKSDTYELDLRKAKDFALDIVSYPLFIEQGQSFPVSVKITPPDDFDHQHYRFFLKRITTRHSGKVEELVQEVAFVASEDFYWTGEIEHGNDPLQQLHVELYNEGTLLKEQTLLVLDELTVPSLNLNGWEIISEGRKVIFDVTDVGHKIDVLPLPERDISGMFVVRSTADHSGKRALISELYLNWIVDLYNLKGVIDVPVVGLAIDDNLVKNGLRESDVRPFIRLIVKICRERLMVEPVLLGPRINVDDANFLKRIYARIFETQREIELDGLANRF